MELNHFVRPSSILSIFTPHFNEIGIFLISEDHFLIIFSNNTLHFFSTLIKYYFSIKPNTQINQTAKRSPKLTPHQSQTPITTMSTHLSLSLTLSPTQNQKAPNLPHSSITTVHRSATDVVVDHHNQPQTYQRRPLMINAQQPTLDQSATNVAVDHHNQPPSTTDDHPSTTDPRPLIINIYRG